MMVWCWWYISIQITTALWVVLVKRFPCWLCCQSNEFETAWTYQVLSTYQWQHRKERWLFKTFQSWTRGPRFAHKLSQRRARVVLVNRGTNCSSQNKKNWYSPILTKEDSQVGIQKLCSCRCLWNHLSFFFYAG